MAGFVTERVDHETVLQPTEVGTSPSERQYHTRPAYGLLAVFAFLSIACVIPIWTCEYFPSQNGPSLLYIVFMQGKLNSPQYGYSEHFDFHPFPTPYLLQTTALNALFLVFSPVLADKVWITCVVLLRPLSVFYFLRGLGRNPAIYALAALPLLYDFSLMRGYFNYHAGVSIAFLLFGYYVRRRKSWTAGSTVIFNLLVLLQYFTHPVALAVTGVLLAAYEFASTRSPARILAVVVRGYIPSLFLLAGFLVWSSLYGAWVHPDVDFLTISDKIQNAHFRGATPLSTAANLLSLAMLAVVVGIGAIGLARRYGRFSFRKVYVSPQIIVHEPMLTVFAAAVLLYLLMPWSVIGWHKADVRILPFIFMLALGIPPSIESAWRRTAFVAGASIVVVAGLFPIAGALREGSDEVAEYVAGIEHVPPRAKILSLFDQPEKSEDWKLGYAIDPVHRADCYYTLFRGGATRNSLAQNNTLYWVWYKDYRSLSSFPTVDTNNPTPEQIATAAERYDAVLLWNGLDDIRKGFEQHGYRTAFQRRRLTILTKPENESAKVSLR